MNLTRYRPAGLVASALLALSLAACGDDTDDDTTSPEANTPDVSDTPSAEPEPEPELEPEPAEEEAATYEPGPLRFRVVNLLDEPADVYVRTDGLVRAYPVALGVEPGATTDFYNPPESGRFVVTTAGAGDATCVAGCTHFITDNTLYADDGDTFTVVLYDDFGTSRGMLLWETPPEDRVGTAANAMHLPEVDTGIAIVTAVAVTDATFGMRIAIDGIAGCQEPLGGSNILVGGNQTPAYAFEGDSADFVLYGNQDQECSGEPIGGPFTVAGGPGTRTHLILSGSPGALEAVVLPMDAP